MCWQWAGLQAEQLGHGSTEKHCWGVLGCSRDSGMWGEPAPLATASLGAASLQLHCCKPNRAGMSWYLKMDKACPSGIPCGLTGLGLVHETVSVCSPGVASLRAAEPGGSAPGICRAAFLSLLSPKTWARVTDLLPCHRIPARQGFEGPSVGHPAQPPAQAGSPRAGGTAPRPGGAGISPEKETPQPPWAAWARAPSPSEGRSSSSCSAGI